MVDASEKQFVNLGAQRFHENADFCGRCERRPIVDANETFLVVDSDIAAKK